MIKINSTFELCDINNRFFVYDGGNGGVYEINKLIKEILLSSHICDFENINDVNDLTHRLSTHYDYEEIKKTLGLLEKQCSNGLLQNEGMIYKVLEYKRKRESDKLRSLSLNISQKCNLRCVYCFGGGGNYGYEESVMSVETAKSCIDYWYENINKSNRNYTVTFFGGEPLLNKKTLLYSVEYINKLMKNIDGNVNYVLTTNGTVIDDDLITLFGANNFIVSISIDGISQIHNKNRPYASGKGSYEKVVTNIQKMKDSCQNISSQITVMRKDIPFLAEAVENIWGIGMKKVYTNLVFDKTQLYSFDDYLEYHNQVKILADKTYENLISDTPYIYGNLVDQMGRIHNKEFSVNCYLWNQTLAAFSSNGDAYRCYRFIGDQTQQLGNINQDQFSVFQDPLSKKHIKRCLECNCQLHCGDGCPYENMLYENDIDEPAGEWCSKTKIQFMESLRLYIRILVNKKELFERLFTKEVRHGI